MIGLGGSSVNDDSLKYYVDAANPKSYSGSGSTWTNLVGGPTSVNITLSAASGESLPAFHTASKTLQFRQSQGHMGIGSLDEGILKQDNELGEFTLETLFKYPGNSGMTTPEAIIIGRSGCHGGIYQFTNNKLYHAVKTTDSGSCWNGAVNADVQTMVSGTWYHTTMVYEVGRIKHYINGAHTATSTFDKNTYSIFNYDNSIYVGGKRAGSTNYVSNADISYCKAYSKALTAAEVKQNYVGSKGRMVT